MGVKRTRVSEKPEYAPPSVEQIDRELRELVKDEEMPEYDRAREADLLLDMRLIAARRERRPAAA